MSKENKDELIIMEKEDLPEQGDLEEEIKQLIYIVRGQQVMLDSDLATLYQIETKVFNQAVNRNIERFPPKFRFQLTKAEYEALRSQIVTSKGKGGRRYMPYVFTEQGIAMLSAVLRSDIAIQISIRIMETFIEMRRFFGHNSLMLDRINEVEVRQLAFQRDTEEKFDMIFSHISEYEESNQKIFFSGQIYDAFSLLIELVLKADNKLVLIDNYVDINTLNILAKKKTNVKVIIYTSKKTKLSQMDINNFNQQYQSLEVKYTDEFHDRFMIIDDITAYHIGASIKDAGKKCFGINLIEDSKIIQDIFARIKTSST